MPPIPPDEESAEEIDVTDRDVSTISEDAREAEGGEGDAETEPIHRPTQPPPLPPDVRASHASFPPAPVHPSQPPPAGSMRPSQAPPKPRTAFYGGLIAIVLVVGLAGGGVVALYVRKTTPPTATAPSVSIVQPAVITIPTVEVDDDHDGGP